MNHTMKYTSIQHINKLLQNSPIIIDVRNKLQQLQQLNKAVANLLPPTIASNCSVANLRDGLLVLTTNSPVWRHQINFLKMDLLDQLRISNPLWAGISAISVTIDYLIEDLDKYQKDPNPVNNINIDSKTKNFNISLETAELMNTIANQSISYQPLSVALKKLIEKIQKT